MAPPYSGEDGGEFPPPPTTGQALGCLPCSLAEMAQNNLFPSLSSAEPTFTADGGALTMSCGTESDSLEARAGIAGPWPSAYDWCL